MKTKFITTILTLAMVLNTIAIGNFTIADAASVSDYVIQEIIDTDFDDTSKKLPFYQSEYTTIDGKKVISFINPSKNSSQRTNFEKATGILEIKYDTYTNFGNNNINYSINVAKADGYSPVRLIYIGKEGNFVTPAIGSSTEKLDNNKWYTILIRLNVEEATMTVKYRLADSNGPYTDVHLYYFDEDGKGKNGTVYPYNGEQPNGTNNKTLPDEIKNIVISNKNENTVSYMDNLKIVEYSQIPEFSTNICTEGFDGDGDENPTASWDKVKKVNSSNPWTYGVNFQKETVTIDMDVYSGTNSYTVSAGETTIFAQTNGNIENNGKYNPDIYSLTSQMWKKLRFTLNKTTGKYKSFIADGDKYFEVNEGDISFDTGFNLSVNTSDSEICIDDVVINDIAPLSAGFGLCLDVNEAKNILDTSFNYSLLDFPLGYDVLSDSQKISVADKLMRILPSDDVQAVLDNELAKVFSTMANQSFFVYDYDFTYNGDTISSLKLSVPDEVTALKIDEREYLFTQNGSILTVNEDINLADKEKLEISATTDGKEQKLSAVCGGYTINNTDFNYYPTWTRKAVTFSLDDGNIKLDEKALSYLNAANIKGTFNLIGSSVGNEMKELYIGHEVGNHGYHHVRAIPSAADKDEYVYSAADGFYYKDKTRYLSVDDFNDSMDRGREVIEKIFGEGSVKSFAWPYGRGAAGNNPEIINKAKTDYHNLRHSVDFGITKSEYFSHPTDLADWERYKEWNVTSLDTDLIPMYTAYRDLHDDGKLKFFAVGMHSSDYEKNKTWDAMKSFCDEMGNKPDLYWYATNTEILDYGVYVKNLIIENGNITNNSPCDLYYISNGKKCLAPANSELKLELCFGDDISGCDMKFSDKFDTITDDSNMSGDVIHGYGNKMLSDITYTASKGASVEIKTPEGDKISDTDIEAYPGIIFECTSGDGRYSKLYTLGYPDICIYAPIVDIRGEGENKTLNVSLQMQAFLPSGKTYTVYAASYKDGELIALNSGSYTIPNKLDTYKKYTIEEFSVCAFDADTYKVMVVDDSFKPLMVNSYADNTSLAGKKILFLGDSITGMADGCYPKYVGSLFGADVYNGGIAGTTLAKGDGELYKYLSLANIADILTDNILDTDMAKIDRWITTYYNNTVEKTHYESILKTVNIDEMDYLSIFYGTNDFSTLTAIDNPKNPKDVYTLKGALRYALDKFKTENEQLNIVVFTPFYRNRLYNVGGIRDGKNSDDYPNASGYYLKDYCTAIKEVCEEYEIPCYNLYELSDIGKLNAKYYIEDGLHPTNSGGRNYLGQLIGKCIAEAY